MGRAPRIAVIFYSATGNVAVMADAIADGARQAGAEVRVHPVAELAPPEAVARNPRWQAWVDSNPYDRQAQLDDLEWADGFAFGTPTRFGGPAAQLKQFVDTAGGLWFQRKLADKVGTSFVSASTGHGGLESTVLAINNIFYHWGSIVLPLGYGEDPGDSSLMRSGNPYGGSFVSRSSARPDEEALTACRLQGARLARITGYVARGLAADTPAEPAG
jgi:NAD(P)H dehydrogenase (quinone)